MQLIGPFRKELRCRTGERCSRRSLKYDDGRKATDAAAARGQSLPLPRSGLVQQDLSVIRKRERGAVTVRPLPTKLWLLGRVWVRQTGSTFEDDKCSSVARGA